MSNYYHRRTYNAGSDGNNVAFVTVILLACSLFAHRAGLLKVEHIAKYVLLVTFVLLALIASIRFKNKFRNWKQQHSPDMSIIDVMTGLAFEQYVAKLLKGQGYSHVSLTEEYDLGVDIIAVKDGITWGVQVKRYSGLVGADAVRQVVTALGFYHCDRAMVVTNSTFSRPAIELADSNDCLLIDRPNLMSWLNYIKSKQLIVS
jgi:HJR/Mrr/RecB family endonuclease